MSTSTKKQREFGFNQSGSKKYQCYECGKNYTLQPNPNGYTFEVRRKDIKLYLEGNSFRGIDRLLNVDHRSLANWVKEYAEQLPKAKVPQNPKEADLDELFTFIGRKNEIYVITVVNQASRYILSWVVAKERTSEAMQACLEGVPNKQALLQHHYIPDDQSYAFLSTFRLGTQLNQRSS